MWRMRSHLFIMQEKYVPTVFEPHFLTKIWGTFEFSFRSKILMILMHFINHPHANFIID
jgi:hypothetical protein